MGAVAEQGTEVLTIAALWAAIKAARRKHRAANMAPVQLTMHPRDLYDLRSEDRSMSVVMFDKVRDCWTAFGLPITERRHPGATSDRVIVLQASRREYARFDPNVNYAATSRMLVRNAEPAQTTEEY